MESSSEEESSLNRKLVEGQLLKFTNVVKGYQYRWCVVDPELGVVKYYEKADHRKHGKPRGTLNLTYASVCPSDEDSQAFTINAANGDFLRLKAADAKERQFWVDRIRAVAEYHSEKAQTHPTVAGSNADPIFASLKLTNGGPSEHHLTCGSGSGQPAHHSPLPSQTQNHCVVPTTESSNHSGTWRAPHSSATETHAVELRNFPVFCPGGSCDPHTQLYELFRQLESEVLALHNIVDATPIRTPELTPLYKTLLLSKATTQAALACLKRCVDLIQRKDYPNVDGSDDSSTRLKDQLSSHSTKSHAVGGGATDARSSTTSGTSLVFPGPPGNSAHSCSSSEPICQSVDRGFFLSPIVDMVSEDLSLPDLPNDTQADVQAEEAELGTVENHKSIVMHLLSQLKNGMDLTKVVLPTFILQKRSLLEMFADHLAHPDLFININRGEDPESRMVAFVQWYLTSFHAGRMDKVAKKPYNPIVGECFHCCWIMPPSGRSTGVDLTDAPSDSPQDVNFDIITYCAEQVSHHPPITAFHVESPVNRMRLDSCVHIKSKFQGMSVSVTLFGKTVLHLGEHDGEEYHFSFPIAYARSIMKTPWLELGDKVSINCPQTGYSASVNFFTKPLRGNKLHRITAEVFAPSNTKSTSPNNLVARVCGVWNGVMQFEQLGDGGKSWTIDVTTLPVTPKYVRPIDKQRPEESRRLWQHVTEALHADNIELATEKKRELEDRQRMSEKFRLFHQIPFPVKYFVWDGTSWNFRGLQKTPTPLISL